MNCKHEINLLMGTADGIVCRGCGRLFKDMDEILKETEPEAIAEPVEKEAPKKKAPAKKKAAAEPKK